MSYGLRVHITPTHLYTPICTHPSVHTHLYTPTLTSIPTYIYPCTHTYTHHTCSQLNVHSAGTHVGELLMRKSWVILADVSSASTPSTISFISLSRSGVSRLTSTGVLSSNWREVFVEGEREGRGGEGRGERRGERREGRGEGTERRGEGKRGEGTGEGNGGEKYGEGRGREE